MSTTKDPTPGAEVTINLDAVRPHVTVGEVVWAWMRDADEWDGNRLYGDVASALEGAAVDYVEHEYPDQDDPESDRPGPLVWRHNTRTRQWDLYDGDDVTAVRVTPHEVLGKVPDVTFLGSGHVPSNNELMIRLIEAIDAEAAKPSSERVGLAHAMIAIVRPDLDRLGAEVHQWMTAAKAAERRHRRELAGMADRHGQ